MRPLNGPYKHSSIVQNYICRIHIAFYTGQGEKNPKKIFYPDQKKKIFFIFKPFTILLTCKEFCLRKALASSLIKQNKLQKKGILN